MTFDLKEARAVLERTPATLDQLLRGLPEPWLTCAEGPDTWSPRDVVAHLAELEDQDWMGRVRTIVEFGESRPFTPIQRDAFLERFRGQSVAQLLGAFAERRRRNLADLDRLGLTADHFARRGRHPDFGPVTLAQLLATWAVHDLAHVGQIVRVMAKRYDQAVGPWRQYLPILTR
jgi:uncharacterized damage-inducible protein DinB